jgi:hypothetical protein
MLKMRRGWLRVVPLVLFAAVGGVALAVSFAVKGGVPWSSSGDTTGAASSAPAAALVCPSGGHVLDTQYSMGGDLSVLPDSPDQALLTGGLDRADQISNGDVKRDDVKRENFQKHKETPNESDTGPGMYVLVARGKVIGEFKIAQIDFQGKPKFYVETVTTCVP